MVTAHRAANCHVFCARMYCTLIIFAQKSQAPDRRVIRGFLPIRTSDSAVRSVWPRANNH